MKNILRQRYFKMSEKEYRELYQLKQELHETMKKLVIKTNLGSIEDENTNIEGISLDFMDGEIYSCVYYEQVRFCNGEEYELDDNLQTVKEIVKELRKRLEKIDSMLDEDKIMEILNKSLDLNIK